MCKLRNGCNPLEVERWAENKSYTIQFLCIFLAPFASTAFEILSPIKKSTPNPFLKPNLEFDKIFYREPLAKCIPDLADSLSGINEYAETISSYLYAYHDRLPSSEHRAPRPYPKFQPEQFKKLQLLDLYDAIAPPKYTKAEKQYLLEKFSTPSFSFLIRVILPCLFFYKEPHDKLYARAISGESTAINKLLRLDRTIIEHTEISRWISHYQQTDQQDKYTKISEGLLQTPPGKLTLQSIKYKISGFIVFIAEAIGENISEPDIRSLYNALSKDYDNNELVDPDLPCSQEAFYKAIQREKVKWKDLFHRLATQFYQPPL